MVIPGGVLRRCRPPADVIAYDFAAAAAAPAGSACDACVFGGELDSGVHAELGEHAAEAAIDGVRRHAQPGGDLAVVHAGGDQPGDLLFGGCQAVPASPGRVRAVGAAQRRPQRAPGDRTGRNPITAPMVAR